MLKKLEKLENALNAKLSLMLGLIWRCICWLTPNLVQKKIIHLKLKLNQLRLCLKAWGIESLKSIKAKLLSLVNECLNIKNNFSSIKSEFLAKQKARKSHLENLVKNTSLKKSLTLITNNLAPLMTKLSKSFKHHSTSQASIIVMAFLFITGGVLSVYTSGQHIYDKEYRPQRAPAAAQQYDYKPEYKMYPRKTSTFFNIKVPLLVQDVADLDSLTIDFSVRTTTRFAKIYLEDYEYKLKDYFFTSVSPIASDFSLEEEGKKEIKDKIKREVNKFLKEHNVESQVEEVRILFIVGS